MPLSLRRGKVTAIAERHEGLVRLEVDGVPCIAYPDVTGSVEVGDDVLVNVQARELELGSGGFDILHANLTRGIELEPEPGAHVMTLPYTSLQHAVRACGGRAARPPSRSTACRSCVARCTRRSCLCARALAGVRVAYVQLAGGAIPTALSDAVRALRARGLIELVVAAGPCVGVEQAVNVYSALAWCRSRGAEVAVCAIGPGIVGTGTAIGHGGVAAAQAVNAAAALGGRPVVAPRVSGADQRPRHRGYSHHTEAVLRLCLAEPLVPEELDPSGWREACDGLPLSHMGRGPDEDPEFFAAAYAAGRLARDLIS